MGSRILAAVASSDPEASRLLAEVPLWFDQWEQTLSRFKEDSKLSKLNRSNGSTVPTRVSETLWQVSQLAIQAARDTGGLITPTILSDLEAAGYSASFETIAGAAGETAKALPFINNMERPVDTGASVTWREIQLHEDTRAVSLPSGVRLDFGGLAKGWAADEAAHRLAKCGPALVNAGGDIALAGASPVSLGWTIGIDAPTGTSLDDGPIDVLYMKSGGVATSGRDYRRWMQQGQWRHHIIDPRTGAPAATDVMAVTVVGASARIAEVAAKVVMLLGSKQGLKWLESDPSLAGVIVLENGRVLRSSRLATYIWSNQHGN